MTSLLRRPASLAASIAMRPLHQAKSSKIKVSARPSMVFKRPELGNLGLRSFSSKETVTITYIDASGDEHPVQAEVGKHLLDVAHDNNIELEGACGGELACSTCHLVFDQDVFDTLPTKSDEEEDMLDLAFELTETSRLGCQIRVTKEFDGIKIRIPDDGY
mmetsp:Transcript_13892/g.28154  ORF Transcript_13892/g.28154 Transcript_13892/m.28154 type:complete len:161 (-) Transcript_13892:297-779(-)